MTVEGNKVTFDFDEIELLIQDSKDESLWNDQFGYGFHLYKYTFVVSGYVNMKSIQATRAREFITAYMDYQKKWTRHVDAN